MNRVFSPVPSLIPFFLSEKFVDLVVGPVGSTKTTAGIVKILYHAKRMAPCSDGIRRSRAVWVRNTREQLRDTSIPDFLKWFPDGLAGVFAKTDSKFILKLDDVECEVLFRGLDDSNDVRRLLSLQASFAILDEFREINKDIFEALQGRLGRYPDGMMVPHRPEWGVDDKGNPIQGCVTDAGVPNSHLWGMSNPPDMDTFWEQLLTNPPENTDVTIQPSGFSPLADWLHLLPTNYYENLAQGKSEAYIDVYIHAKFGKSLAGQPVFKAFDANYHVAPAALRPIINGWRPLLIGMDFGLNPSAVIGQLDATGRLLIYRALTSDGMGLIRFLRQHLKPVLAQDFAGAPLLVIGDPAGRARVQTDERTVYDILKAEGMPAIAAHTNSIVARVAAVDQYLTRQVDTGAGLLIDPSCRALILAMRGGYRYKLKTNGEYETEPEKNIHSHICFAAGTKVATPSGARAIETLRAGDTVDTPVGPRPVVAAGMSALSAPVSLYTFSNGAQLVATPEHPVATQRGWVRIDELQHSDVLFGVGNNEAAAWLGHHGSWSSTGYASQSAAQEGTSSRHHGGDHDTYTGTCGASTTALYPLGALFTTGTMILPTTTSAISSWYVPASTNGTICSSDERKPRSFSTAPWLQLGRLRKTGIGPTLAASGTGSTRGASLLRRCASRWPARGATECSSGSLARASGGFAPPRAKGWRARLLEWTTSRLRALTAALRSPRTGTRQEKHALRLVAVQPLAPRSVYAIRVADAACFYAEGVLVSNCDAMEYLCLHADASQGGRAMQTSARKIEGVSMRAWT